MTTSNLNIRIDGNLKKQGEGQIISAFLCILFSVRVDVMGRM
ncbi:hypothetical protein [Histophilus somni]|nr:hypothetical protein [Histophilus somni]MBB5150620.1 hypothetical protein [Histophilus somni]